MFLKSSVTGKQWGKLAGKAACYLYSQKQPSIS
ncbi:hypothetical protein Pan241w_56280 [Gimesia alba]|uniref:Uncharacterized protein n=1 Tax=Gimesia alba TaxID=2527973 RepID=A0A517RNN9_9PLAN|nr:hypothetical protein Pan241w_56280 [Gimesia alba]